MDTNSSVNNVDYAESGYCDKWMHHPVFGDVSYDSFEHSAYNPVCRGTDEYRWPVNGSLFKDPVSGDWFLYVGWYLQYYAIKDDVPLYCEVYRSKDRGKTWEACGRPIAGMGSYIFDGEISPLGGAPDAAVCYKDGRYYMSFDWQTMEASWEKMLANDPNINNGSACAVSDSPEGPFQPVAAILKTREMLPLHGKYKRVYASTILPRKDDWIALTLTDSQSYYGWGLIGQTAPVPEGPWSEPKLLLHPQLDCYYPQLMEFFPQFVHDGYIYAPSTSVAANRNYQVIFRSPIDKAMDTSSWSIYQAGSVWHSQPVEWEYEGIWGQTFSGFIDDDGTFHVMYPSLDQENRGTINIAGRKWDQPMQERGFVISSHQQSAMTVLQHNTLLKHLHSELEIHGTVQLVWNHRGPFGPDRPTSGCGLHPLMQADFDALELTESGWCLVSYSKDGKRTDIASGQFTSSHNRTVDLNINNDELAVTIDGDICWNGECKTGFGRIGLWLEPHSHIKCDTFTVEGESSETAIPYLYTEGIICAAQDMADWEEVESSAFRYGKGVVSKSGGVEVKWNFTGDGFAIYAPTGPEYGKGELLLDGKQAAIIDFSSADNTKSRILYEQHGIPFGRYGVKLRVTEGHIPVDVFEAYSH